MRANRCDVNCVAIGRVRAPAVSLIQCTDQFRKPSGRTNNVVVEHPGSILQEALSMLNRPASDLAAARGIDRRAFIKQTSLTLLALAPATAGFGWAEPSESNFVVAETAFGK